MNGSFNLASISISNRQHWRRISGVFALLFAALWNVETAQAQEGDPEETIRMLVPGFTVRELPLRLPNVNNLRFAPDGRLTALGYDGKVHLLRDTDGDGLEDEAEIFWDQSDIRVPVGMAWSERGLYISSQGKVSLLRDTSGNGRADTEETIASGWTKTDVGSGGVDATAVTVDSAGNVYFGLISANYSNPYRIKDGVAHYDLASPRGTIQKIEPGGEMETVATGIRVPYALVFNRAGDLFTTDQEGETWLEGANPLDELLHIIPGRHYGFPPQHEKHLPDVIDEPAVVGFGPQHQSTCGFLFNEREPGRRSFGPDWWEGDAIVTGQSRGKLWRTRLVKTPSGYVGRETLIAALRMLTLDVALSPEGDLYVACHTGGPDWGTGPKGEGRLFKISHADRAAPQPVIAWASGPTEVRVSFDQPLSDFVTREAPLIEFGEYVRAADRFEMLKPPYKSVQQQADAPRGRLRVVSTDLSSNRRTLILTTDPHPQSVSYALTLRNVQGQQMKGEGDTMDLAYDLSGVSGEWRAQDSAEVKWQGWLPHLDLQVSRAFTPASTTHAELEDRLSQAGYLRLRTQLVLPAGRQTVRLQNASGVRWKLGNQEAVAEGGASQLVVESDGMPIAFEMEIPTGGEKMPAVHVSSSSETDPTVRPISFQSLLLPWAMPQAPVSVEVPPEQPDLVGGDFEAGKALFSGDRLRCSSCHRLGKTGRENGPDLSNLRHRDAASVLRDIRQPSATINPDYVAYIVKRLEGGTLFGFVRAKDKETLIVTNALGEETVVERKEVREMRASPVSLMPPGLVDSLTDQELRDLLAFLLREEP